MCICFMWGGGSFYSLKEVSCFMYFRKHHMQLPPGAFSAPPEKGGAEWNWGWCACTMGAAAPWASPLTTTLLWWVASWTRMSWNHLNYKSTSTKTIAGAIKFSHLSTYIYPSSPWNHEGFQTNQPTSQDCTWFNTTHHLLQHFTNSLWQLTYIAIWISYYKPSLK
jgi:hypothetical protein